MAGGGRHGEGELGGGGAVVEVGGEEEADAGGHLCVVRESLVSVDGAELLHGFGGEARCDVVHHAAEAGGVGWDNAEEDEGLGLGGVVDGVAHGGERAGGVAEQDPLLVAEGGAEGFEVRDIERRSDGGGVERDGHGAGGAALVEQDGGVMAGDDVGDGLHVGRVHAGAAGEDDDGRTGALDGVVEGEAGVLEGGCALLCSSGADEERCGEQDEGKAEDTGGVHLPLIVMLVVVASLRWICRGFRGWPRLLRFRCAGWKVRPLLWRRRGGRWGRCLADWLPGIRRRRPWFCRLGRR